MMPKKPILSAFSILIICAATCYTFVVFVLQEGVNSEMRHKVSTTDRWSQELSLTTQTLSELQETIKQMRQQYAEQVWKFNHPDCNNGAYAEIVSIATKHNINIRKMERQLAKEVSLSQSEQSWSRIDTTFQLVGSWSDYLKFRSDLATCQCLLQAISERTRAAKDIFDVVVDLSLFVLQLQPVANPQEK